MIGRDTALGRPFSAAVTLPARTQPLPINRAGSPAATQPPPPPAAPARGIRVEIQALRALAMALVVVYHVFPEEVSGGYVGVDVFFVVSGFLITGHLLREVERSGRVRLAAFWARRARRLLPASLLVLATSAVAIMVWVPETFWQGWLREIGGSALYVENWLLARDAVDYLAHTNAASPAQHYWSLATEEQFYLVWPVLIVVAAWLAVRLGGARRTAVVAVLAVVTAVSFGFSLAATTSNPPAAYFTTPSRAWEFALGGLLAGVCAVPPAGREHLRTLVSWAGFGAIGWAGFTFTAATPFPGTAALLPVLGTVAVIWGGAPRSGWSPTGVADAGPVRLLGDVSYSAYLWHWPLVILLPFVLGHDLDTTTRVGILVATVALAWATKVCVEDPIRTGTPLVRRGAWATLLAMGVATGLVVALAAFGWSQVDRHVEQAREAATEAAEDAAAGNNDCFGAAAMLPVNQCADPFAYTPGIDPTFAKNDESHGFDCMAFHQETDLRSCRFGSPTPVQTVALFGDSHTASLYEAMEVLAQQRNWAVVTYLKAGCPPFGTERLAPVGETPQERASCEEWAGDAVAAVAADPTITRVFTSYRSDVYRWIDPDGDLHWQLPEPLVGPPLRSLTDAGKRVTVVRAVPTSNGRGPENAMVDVAADVPDCIALAGPVDDPCAGPRADRLTPDHYVEAVQALGDVNIDVVDLTDAFCDARTCHQVIGGVIVYNDGSHLTGTFSRTLGPFLADRVGV